MDIDSLTGAWLGGGLQMDENVFRPASQFMLIDSSSQVRMLSGEWRDTFQDFTIRADSILFPYRSYPVSAFRFEADRLKIGKNYPLVYKKVESTVIRVDSITLKNDFFLGQWVSSERILDLSAEEALVIDRNTGEKRKMCWDIRDFQGVKLLQLKGSFIDCNSPYEALAILHSISKDSMVLEQWINGDFQKLTYKKEKVDMSIYNYPEFVLCNPYLYENSSGDWYYFKYTSFDGGLYRLKQIFDDRYSAVVNGNRDGLLKVSFVINCAGEIGRITSEEMNQEYERFKLNPEIKRQIITILKQAGNWMPGEYRDQNLDTYKFLIFKIRDGIIDEIYP